LEDLKIAAVKLETSRQARRRRQFIKVPVWWLERLGGARGQTAVVALRLLYLTWRDRGAPVKLANSSLSTVGVGRFAKGRALVDLERRGLVRVDRRPKKSPLVRIIT
jgi:hypothetical protein